MGDEYRTFIVTKGVPPEMLTAYSCSSWHSAGMMTCVESWAVSTDVHSQAECYCIWLLSRHHFLCRLCRKESHRHQWCDFCNRARPELLVPVPLHRNNRRQIPGLFPGHLVLVLNTKLLSRIRSKPSIPSAPTFSSAYAVDSQVSSC